MQFMQLADVEAKAEAPSAELMAEAGFEPERLPETEPLRYDAIIAL